MGHHIRGISKVVFAIVLVVQNFNNIIQVKAIDTDQYVMDLVIDDQQSSLSLDFSIDKIDRFNKYGVAIIMDDTVQADGTISRKYGLMSSFGKILLDPIYNNISNFDSNGLYFRVEQGDYNSNWYDFKQGLVSQKPNAQGALDIVLPIRYNWIPSIEENNLIELGYMVDAKTNQWKNEIYSVDPVTGEIENITPPSGVILNDYSYLWLDRVNDDFYMMYAQREVQNGWESKSWLVNKFGQPLKSFDKVFDWINIKRSKDGTIFAAVQKYDAKNQKYQSGLYEITVDSNHQVSTTAIFDENKYENVWYNPQEDYVYVSYQTTDNQWVQGRYSLEDKDWISGFDPNAGQINEFPLWQNEVLTVSQSCKLDGSTNKYVCLATLFETGDPDKTNLFGGTKQYNNVYSPSEDYVILQNMGTPYPSSNILIKKMVNSEATYFMLFDQDVTGHLWINNFGWLTVNNSTEYLQFDLSLVSATTSLANLKLTDAYVNNGFDSWTIENRYQYFRKVVSDGRTGPYIVQNHLFDIQAKKYLLKDVYNLNYTLTQEGNLVGTYSKTISTDKTQLSGSVGFIYDLTKTTAEFRELPNIQWISNFNANNIAKIQTTSNKQGYIDSLGKYVINPDIDTTTYIDYIREVNRYDGENDLLFAQLSNQTINLYVVDGNPKNEDANLKLEGLTKAENYNKSFPTLISKKTDGIEVFSYFNRGVMYESNTLTYLANVQKASPFSNGLSLILSGGDVYPVNAALAKGDPLSISLGDQTIKASDLNGNIVKFGSVLKLAYLKTDNTIGYVDLPTSLSAYDISNFSQMYENVYRYNNPSQGLMYFDKSDLNSPKLIDLGPYSGYGTESSNDSFISYFNEVGGKVTVFGYLAVDGSFQIKDETGLYDYRYDGRFISVRKKLSDTNFEYTLMNLDKTYPLTETVDGQAVPKFYSGIHSNTDDNTVYSLSTWVDQSQTNSTLLIKNDGTFQFMEGVWSYEIQNTDLIQLNKRIDEQRSIVGLMRKDGTVIAPFNESDPFVNIEVNTKFSVIIPRKEVVTKYGRRQISTGFYDFSGNLIPELKGYLADGWIDSKGNVGVYKPTNYRRIWNDGYEDISTKNVYNFATRTFLYERDYYNSQTVGTLKTFTYLDDLEKAPLYQQNKSSDAFVKKEGDTWGTTQYSLTSTTSVSTLDNIEIIPPGKYWYVDINNDHLIVYQQVQGLDYFYFQSGILDKNGEPLACAEYRMDGDAYALDLNGQKIIDLTCSNIEYNKKLNRFTFEQIKTVDNPYQDSSERYWTLYLYGYYDIAEMKVKSDGFADYNQRSLDQKGYSTVSIYENFLDADPSNDSFDAIDSSTKRFYGIIREDGTYMVEPKYEWIQDFNTNGYTKLRKDLGMFECPFYENGELIMGQCQDSLEGIFSKHDGMVLNPEYSFIAPTNLSLISGSDVPNFDNRGLWKLIKRVGSFESGIYLNGLADKGGELFGGALYEFAYFLNGEFYLKKPNEDWMIIKDENITDEQMRGSAWTNYLLTNASSIERLDFNLESTDTLSMDTMERVGVEIQGLFGTKVENYFIVKTTRYDEDFNKSYDYYGVVRQDGSTYLDYEYTNIAYDTVTKTWKLEIYNPVFGTEQKAVMAQDKTFVVPFNNKYDSIGDYVDGFAIGTSGQAPAQPQPTSALPFVEMLFSAFFLPVQAAQSNNELVVDTNNADNQFVLDIIDKNGNVVGDLSQEYESAVLLGAVGENGEVKALVKKDGQYFIATLKQVPFTGEKITAVEVDRPNVTLTKGDSTKLFAEIFPLTSTQPKTITWTSSNPDIVSVDGKGNIKALQVGTATITLKVNKFIATSVVTVNEVVQASTETVVENIVKSIEKTQSVTLTFSQKLNAFVESLDGVKTISDIEFKAVLKDLVSKDDQFYTYLNDNQAQALEERILKLFANSISIETPNVDIPVVIKGLVLQLDLASLLNGEKIDVSVDVDTDVPQEDVDATIQYLKDRLIDSSLMYALNITITQTVKGSTSTLTLLNRPITLTFELPNDFIGIGDLEVIRVHDGTADSLNVILNPDYTFSFNTDRLSSFTLVKKQDIKRIDEPKQDIIVPAGNSFPYWPLVGGVGVIVVGTALYIVRKRSKRLIS